MKPTAKTYALVLWGGITHKGIRRTTVVLGRWEAGRFHGKRVDRRAMTKTVWKHAREFSYAEVLACFDHPPKPSEIERERRRYWWVLQAPAQKHPERYAEGRR